MDLLLSFRTWNTFIHLSVACMCVYKYICMCDSVSVAVRGQLTELGSFLLPWWGSRYLTQGMRLGNKHSYLPTPHQPRIHFCKSPWLSKFMLKKIYCCWMGFCKWLCVLFLCSVRCFNYYVTWGCYFLILFGVTNASGI